MEDFIQISQWLISQKDSDQEFLVHIQPFLQIYGYWEHATNLLHEFLLISERSEDWEIVIQLRIQKAKYLALHGRLDQAEKILYDIDKLIKKLETPELQHRLLAVYLQTRGMRCLKKGYFDKAFEVFKQSLDIEESLGREHGLAVVMNSYGISLQRKGHFEKSLQTFRKSYEILLKSKDLRGQAMVLNSLGVAQQRMGKFQEAEEAFQKSVVVEEKLKNECG